MVALPTKRGWLASPPPSRTQSYISIGLITTKTREIRRLEHASRAYEGGAAGLTFWDSIARIMNKPQWHTVRRLGHKEELKALAQHPADYNLHPLKRLYDWNCELRYG